MPNGNHVFSNFNGTIVFNNKLYLTVVLYVPQFAFNFISTSKLSLNLNYNLIFSSTQCMIHDNQTKERFGLVDAKAYLYIFESHSFRNNTTSYVVPSFNCTVKGLTMWHYRM